MAFIVNPEFLSKITSPTGSWVTPNPTQAMMRGLDGKHYVLQRSSGGADENVYLLCIEDGTATQLDAGITGFGADVEAEFPDLDGDTFTFPDTTWAVPDSENFILFRSILATQVAIVYGINPSGTVVRICGTRCVSLSTSAFEQAQTRQSSAQRIGTNAYIAYGGGAVGTPFITRISLAGTEDEPDPGSWELRTTQLGFDDGIFNGGWFQRTPSCEGCIVEKNDTPGVLILVNQAMVDGTVGGVAPRMLFSNSVDEVTDYSEAFGIPRSDVLKKFDETDSSNNADDYCGPSSFKLNGDWIISEIRGFTTKAQKLRGHFYNWNNGAPFRIDPEFTTDFVDVVADLGELEAERDITYPNSIHAGYDSTVNKVMVQARINDADSGNGSPPDLNYFSWIGSFGAESTTGTSAFGCCSSGLSEGEFDDTVWDIPDLGPRNLGIIKRAAPIGGGRALVNYDPAEASGYGFWNIILGEIPLITRAQVLNFRAIEAKLTGRIGVALLHFCDGRRAPLPNGGGDITALASGDFMPGDVSGALQLVSGEVPIAGMHFSTTDRLYRITSVGSPTGDVYPITFWPKVRELIMDTESLEFHDLRLRCRLEDADGMHINLEQLRYAFPTLSFVEDVLPDSLLLAGSSGT